MSLLVAADAKSSPGAVYLLGPVTRLANKVLNSKVRFQHLPVPFELYSDGIDLPVFEEFGAGTAALHLRDQLERNKLLADPEYRRRFRKSFDRRKLAEQVPQRRVDPAVDLVQPVVGADVRLVRFERAAGAGHRRDSVQDKARRGHCERRPVGANG